MTFIFKTLFTFALLFTLQNSMAQEAIKNTVKQEAEKMSKALLDGDYELLMNYTHPNIIKLSGGKQKMVDFLKKQMSKLADEGLQFSSVVIGEPTEIKMHKGKYQTLVPKTTTMTMNGQKIISKDYLFGFSDRIGEKWTFVEADKMKSEAAKQFFPGFTTDIIIPEKEAPITVDEEEFTAVPEFDENEGTYDTAYESGEKIGYIIGVIVGILLIIGLLLGIIFLAIYLSKKREKVAVITTKPQATISKKNEIIICKECEGKNKSDSKYCSFCGYSL